MGEISTLDPNKPKREYPYRAKVRVGVRNSRILSGEMDLSEWSDEELERGRLADKNGKFGGRPPVVVPRQVHQELVRRTLRDAQELMRSNLLNAVEELTRIATDPEADPNTKIKAITIIMDRVMGKAPEKVEISAETPPWMQALQGGIIRARAEQDEANGVIDVEVVEGDRE